MKTKRLENANKCEEAIQKKEVMEHKFEEKIEKTKQQMKKMKEMQLVKKRVSEIKAV